MDALAHWSIYSFTCLNRTYQLDSFLPHSPVHYEHFRFVSFRFVSCSFLPYFGKQQNTPNRRPYSNACVITAQILSIFAFLISWIWWVTFIISFIVMVLLQIIWCCRQNRAGIMASIVVSFISFIACLFSAIWALVVWKGSNWCAPFFFISDDSYDDYYSYDYCPEGAWAAVAFFDAALWLAVAGCMLYFEFSGRHAALDKRWSDQNTSTSDENVATVAAEMGTVEQIRAPSATVTAAATANVPVARAMLMPDNNSCIPPAEVSKKAEEA
uniref:MARVEL domain-containing protein n=1 Tax=Pseudo-nitzschia australis TaxID=44445 RepID=A0A7S4AIK0_9STRA